MANKAIAIELISNMKKYIKIKNMYLLIINNHIRMLL